MPGLTAGSHTPPTPPTITTGTPEDLIVSMANFAVSTLMAADSTVYDAQQQLSSIVSIEPAMLTGGFPTYGSIQVTAPINPNSVGPAPTGAGFSSAKQVTAGYIPEKPTPEEIAIYQPTFGGPPGKPAPIAAFNAPTVPTSVLGAVPNILEFVEPERPLGEPGTAPVIASYVEQERPLDRTDPTLLSGVPVVAPIEIPEPPEISVESIAKPTITEVELPEAPVYLAPEFTGVAPDKAPTAPTDLDVTMRQSYDDINPVMRDVLNTQFDLLMDKYFPSLRSAIVDIETRLNTYLQGGTALPAHIEQAIYQRTLDKTNEEATRANRTAWSNAAKAGFTMPPVALLNIQKDLDQGRRDNNARAAIDIAIKQAELEQANLQFAVTQSINFRQVALNAGMTYFQGMVQVNGQALDYARSIVDSIVKAYDVAAKHAEIQARVYEAEVRVYEARLKGAMAAIEVYTAQVNAARAVAEVDATKASVYKAIIDGLVAESNLYQAQIAGVQAQIAAERMKVEIYQAKVNAYGSQVNAFTSQWQGYEAAVRGESAKVQASAEAVKAYQSEVEAWATKWKGYEARVGAEREKINASAEQVRAYQAQVQAYVAEWQGYSERVKAEATKVQASTEPWKAYTYEVDAYKSEVQTEGAKVDASARGVEAKVNVYKAESDVYGTMTQAMIGELNAEVNKYRGDIEGYSANQTAIAEFNKANIARDEAMLRELNTQKEMLMNILTENYQGLLRQKEGFASLANTMSSIYGHMSQAALSGLNSLAATIVSS